MALYFIDDRTNTDPWQNLAREECLLSRCAQDDVMLYLWQNASTVVIGRHQNPWRECRAELLDREGGKLARRITGGGAVFHDLGNLNFSFIAGASAYDLQRHLSVVLNAVHSLGIEAGFSGRNDILSCGRKFSGNAFARRPHASLHHGTLLVSVDMQMLGRYLQVPVAKMESKGIKSVQSRVVNLSELNPAVTVESLRTALTSAFKASYGSYTRHKAQELIDPGLYSTILARQQSWDWRFGQTPRFDVSLENRFPWGGVEIQLSACDGRIGQAAVYSDAMDETFISSITSALQGIVFSPLVIADAVLKIGSTEACDLSQWLCDLHF